MADQAPSFSKRADQWCRWNGKKYVGTHPFRWHIGAKGSNAVIVPQVGFEFDVSIPWCLRWLFDPHDERYLAAAYIHDWLLHVLDWDRGVAGGTFYDILRASGVGRVHAALMAAGTFIGRPPWLDRFEAWLGH